MKQIIIVATMAMCGSLCAWADAPTLSVENVIFRQRYPWNGLVDIDCTVNCSDSTTNISLYMSAKDTAANKSLAVRSVWLENDTTHTNALEVKSGTHRLVWDAGRDNPNFVGDAVTVEVQAYTCLYLVIDLSGGPDAASYPVSYLSTEPQSGWTDEYKTTKLVMRRIQPGTFTMGSPSDEFGRFSDEDQHEVTISQPFYIGVFEVTQKQYELVTGAVPSGYIGDARPVECVTWNMIRGNSSTYDWPDSSEVDPSTFIGKLRTKAGIEELDLPTEAQWEYACRAGTTTAFNSGKNLTSHYQDSAMDEVGRYSYNNGYKGGCKDGRGGYSDYHTTVGSYLPNAWGLYDMHGNVWEWTLDGYQSNLGMSSVTDPAGPSSKSFRVLRGGSWRSTTNICRSSSRSRYRPRLGGDEYGFRLVGTLPNQ